MNIKNRIKKLEGRVGDKQPYCDCLLHYYRGTVDAVYDNLPFDEKAFSLPQGNYCDKCEKPVNSPFEPGVVEDINVAYGGMVH